MVEIEDHSVSNSKQDNDNDSRKYIIHEKSNDEAGKRYECTLCGVRHGSTGNIKKHLLRAHSFVHFVTFKTEMSLLSESTCSRYMEAWFMLQNNSRMMTAESILSMTKILMKVVKGTNATFVELGTDQQEISKVILCALTTMLKMQR